MLKKIILTLAVIVLCFVGFVSVQPTDFEIARKITIAAPPSAVFAQVNDLHNFQAWSPWAKLDPAAKNSFEGPSAGTGAIFKWSGNNDVGEGINTITDSRPYSLIRIKLEFVRPFKGTNTSEFTFQPAGDHTVVRWSMYGKRNFLSKAVGLFMNCDEMVGGQFEKGLASLKSVVEKQ